MTEQVSGRGTAGFVIDGSWERHGDTVVAGSPLRLFRLTPLGRDVAQQLERCTDPFAGLEPARRAGVERLVDRFVEAGAVHPTPGPSGRFGTADVTVVTPVYRRSSGGRHQPIAPTLGGARRALVDDGSEPPIDGAERRFDTNCGPATARNAGLELVETPLVAFVDDDVELPDGWLDALLGHFDDDRVALVAPRVGSTPAEGALARYEQRHSPLDLGGAPARVHPGSRVGYVPAAAIVCRADALRGIGGFDESLRFGEDVDLVWRLVDAGWRCRYDPRVVARHAPRPSWAAWVRQRIGYGSSAAPLARRHPGAVAPARMSGWTATAWAAVALRHPIAGALIAVGTGLALVRKLDHLPAAVAFRLATVGNVAAGRSLASAMRRVWWPLLAVASFRSRTARRVLAVSLVAAGDPRRAADDVAYSIGVWRGIWRERSFAPLVPDLSAWPQRTRAR